MAKVNVEQAIKGEPKKVFKAVKEYLEGRDTLKKLGAKIRWEEKTCSGEIEGGAFSGSVTVKADGKSSLVAIQIELPLLMSAFKGKVKEELEKHLSRIQA